jgi:hypothetical protein
MLAMFKKIKHSDHRKKNVAKNRPGHVYTEQDAAEVIGRPLLVQEQEDNRTRFFGEVEGKIVVAVVSAAVSAAIPIDRIVTMHRSRLPKS